LKVNAHIKRLFILTTRDAGPKREELAGGCRRLQNEEIQNLNASPNKEMSETCSKHKSHENYTIFDAKLKKKRPLRRCRRRWEDNI
jgi:hypothetical protein